MLYSYVLQCCISLKVFLRRDCIYENLWNTLWLFVGLYRKHPAYDPSLKNSDVEYFCMSVKEFNFHVTGVFRGQYKDVSNMYHEYLVPWGVLLWGVLCGVIRALWRCLQNGEIFECRRRNLCKFAKVSVSSYVHMLQYTGACSSTDTRTMILLSLRSGLDATKRRTDWRGDWHRDTEQPPKNRANRQSRNTHTHTQSSRSLCMPRMVPSWTKTLLSFWISWTITSLNWHIG
jgi:hypothetical protein